MITIRCIEIETGRRFDRKFSDYLKARNFIIRCKFSVKVLIEAVFCDDPDIAEALNSI